MSRRDRPALALRETIEFLRRFWSSDEAFSFEGETFAFHDARLGFRPAPPPKVFVAGRGPQVLEAFTRDVVFARPHTNACVATVEELNSRSWRAFEKAGFRHVRDVVEDGLPHRLMRLDRRYAQ